MTVLRSREILPVKTTPNARPRTSTTTKRLRSRTIELEPSTPAQKHEPSPSLSPPTPHTPPSPSVHHRPLPDPKPPEFGSGSDSVSVLGAPKRRSLRLASRVEQTSSGREPDSMGGRRLKSRSSATAAVKRARADGGVSGGESSFYLMGKKVKVNAGIDENGVRELGTGGGDKVVVDGDEGLRDKGLAAESNNESKGKRKLNTGVELREGDEEEGGVLNLRSWKRVSKRKSEEEEEEEEEESPASESREGDEEEALNLRSGKRVAKRSIGGVAEEEDCVAGKDGDDGDGAEPRTDHFSSQDAEEESRRRKGKRKIDGKYEQGIGNGTEIKKDKVDYGVIQKLFDPEEEAIAFQNLIDSVEADAQKFKDKGKDILVENDSTSSSDDDDDDEELDLQLRLGREHVPERYGVVQEQTSGDVQEQDRLLTRDEIYEIQQKERKLERSRKFAVGAAKEKKRENHRVAAPSVAAAEVRAKSDDEDWPGPFKTAMKIIEDRAKKIVPVVGSSVDKSKRTPVIWTPKRKQDQEDPPKRLVPSLLELCVKGVTKCADTIVSLELVPDALRHWLSSLMCCSRTMSIHFFKLLLQGSPTEIRIQDCSFLTEEQFANSLQGFDPSNLRVLRLDLCGRCLPDYVVLATLARSPNSMPALTTLSLTGACRLSDVGLKALVSSAPAIRSINLSQCSFLTSCSLDSLANSLGSSLRELYLDDCQGIDPMVSLPALKKLEQLEVLSLAGIEKVCDDFIIQFIKDRGNNLKKLVLSGCINLTDSSLKVIAETCSRLSAIDLMKLSNLTDNALANLACGCHTIETLKLCRNQFSDEGLAAFLESSGEPLKELWLNSVKKVGCNTALSLARRSSRLHILDLSWCRNLTDEDMGLIVDSCLSIRLLKIFGCTQITNVFFDGHSNPNVKILGRPMSNVQDHIMVPDPLGEMHYFSLPSSI